MHIIQGTHNQEGGGTMIEALWILSGAYCLYVAFQFAKRRWQRQRERDHEMGSFDLLCEQVLAEVRRTPWIGCSYDEGITAWPERTEEDHAGDGVLSARSALPTSTRPT